MIFGRTKRKLNQETFYVGKDQIDWTHEYECLGTDLYSGKYTLERVLLGVTK